MCRYIVVLIALNCNAASIVIMWGFHFEFECCVIEVVCCAVSQAD